MTSERIAQMYDELDLTIEQIAAEEQLEPAFVKSQLAVSSQKYRKALKLNEEEDITDDEYKLLLAGYKQLALGSENDSVREKATKFLIEEKKGRNEARIRALVSGQNMNGGNFNILVLQNAIEASKKAKERLKLVGNGSGNRKKELIEA